MLLKHIILELKNDIFNAYLYNEYKKLIETILHRVDIAISFEIIFLNNI